MIIRKLLPLETLAYRKLRLESLKNAPDAFGASYEDEASKPSLFFERFIKEELKEKFMMGAFIDNELIGICGFIREEQLRSCHRGIIIQMYVKPKYQGQKAGTGIINAVITEAFNLPGLEVITLGVIADNIAANKIYESAGFKEYGFLKSFYKAGDRELDHRFMCLYKQF